jgi:hypothetical protein
MVPLKLTEEPVFITISPTDKLEREGRRKNCTWDSQIAIKRSIVVHIEGYKYKKVKTCSKQFSDVRYKAYPCC